MFIIFFIVFFVVVSYYLYSKVNTKQTSNLKELYSEGLDMLESGKRFSAYNNFKEIIEKDSNNIMAYLRLGQVLRESGNYTKAIKIHKSLLLRKKMTSYEMIELHKNLSLDYFKIENYKYAIKECKEILKINEKNDWALNQIIKLYKKINDWENASKYLKIFLEYSNKKDDNKLALYKIHQAKEKIKKKDYNGAKEELNKAILLNKENSLIYYFLAKTISEESNEIYEKAAEIEKKGLENYKNQDDYNNYIKEAKNILSKAIPNWTHFCEIDPDKSWLVFPPLKDALFVLDRYSEMESILNQLHDNYPDNIEILTNLADYHSHKGEFDKAIDIIDMAIEKDENAYLAKLIKMKLILQKSNNEKLLNDLDDLINSLVKNNRFKILNNSAISNDIKKIFELNE